MPTLYKFHENLSLARKDLLTQFTLQITLHIDSAIGNISNNYGDQSKIFCTNPKAM